MHTRKNQPGFTLIELLVVISIIGFVASAVFASVRSANAKARDARRKQDLHQLATAIELYYDANGEYPPDDSSNSTNNDWSPDFKAKLAPYLKVLPRDPLQDEDSWRHYSAWRMSWNFSQIGGPCDGHFVLWSYFLENPNDPDYPASDRNCKYAGHYFIVLDKP